MNMNIDDLILRPPQAQNESRADARASPSLYSYTKRLEDSQTGDGKTPPTSSSRVGGDGAKRCSSTPQKRAGKRRKDPETALADPKRETLHCRCRKRPDPQENGEAINKSSELIKCVTFIGDPNLLAGASPGRCQTPRWRHRRRARPPSSQP